MEKKKNKKAILRWILIPLSIILAFTGGFFSHYLFRSKSVTLATDIIKIMEKVGYVYDETTGEKRPITSEEIADALVSGLFDKHSAYYTKEEYKAVEEADKGNNSGIGVTFTNDDNVIDVVVFNSPAEIKGIKAGDRIVSCEINGALSNINSVEDFSNFMNPIQTGTEFTIMIERDGAPLTFTVKKENYVSALVQYKDSQKTFAFRSENGKLVGTVFDGGMALDDKTAYIEFTGFDRGAGEQMEKALAFIRSFDQEQWNQELRRILGNTAETVIALEKDVFHNNDVGEHAKRLERIVKHWDDILRFMDEELPSTQEIERIMKELDMAMEPEEIGFTRQDTLDAFRAARDTRKKYLTSSMLWDMGELYEMKLP